MNILKSIFRGLFSDEISSLEKQVQSKQNALAEKEATIKGIRREKQRLVAQLDSCKQEISNLENKAYMLQGTISDKDTELSTQDQRILVLERSVSEKQSESENDRKLIKEYLHHIESLKSEKNELERLIESQKQLIKDTETQTQQFENNSRLAAAQIENLNSQKSALEIKIHELTHKLSEAQSIVLQTEKVLAEKSDSLQSKEAELTEVKEAGKTLEEEVNRLTGLMSEINGQIGTLTSKNDVLEAEKQSLLAKLNELQSRSSDEELLTALRNDVKQKQDIISALETDIQHLNEEISLIRIKNSESNSLINEKIRECEELKNALQSISAQYEEALREDKSLSQAEKRIAELENSLKSAPTLNELIKRDREIERLKAKIREYEAKINDLSSPSPKTEVYVSTPKEPLTPNSQIAETPEAPINSEPKIHHSRPVYRKPKFPYRKKPIAPSKDVVTVDFPVIENDNVYSQTSRLIDKVFNHRSNSFITANDIFLHKSVEEISRMRFELEEAARTGVPYLTCPCCRNMVKI